MHFLDENQSADQLDQCHEQTAAQNDDGVKQPACGECVLQLRHEQDIPRHDNHAGAVYGQAGTFEKAGVYPFFSRHEAPEEQFQHPADT